MISRLRSELAYAAGLLRVVRATQIVTKRPAHTLGDHLAEWAAQYGERPALSSDRESYSYRELDARANAYARWASARGLKKGDAVALLMPNRPEYVAIWFGLARGGDRRRAGQHQPHRDEPRPQPRRRFAPRPRSSTPRWPRRFATAEAAARRLISTARRPKRRAAARSGDRSLLRRAARGGGAPGADARRPRALHLHVRHHRPAEGGAHHPFAGAAHHARIRGGDRRADRATASICACRCITPTAASSRSGSRSASAARPISARNSRRRAFWSDCVREKCTLFVYIGELCRYLMNSPVRPEERQHKIRACVGNGLQARHLRGVPEALRHSRGAGILRLDRRQCGDGQFRLPPRRHRPHSGLGGHALSRDARRL